MSQIAYQTSKVGAWIVNNFGADVFETRYQNVEGKIKINGAEVKLMYQVHLLEPRSEPERSLHIIIQGADKIYMRGPADLETLQEALEQDAAPAGPLSFHDFCIRLRRIYGRKLPGAV